MVKAYSVYMHTTPNGKKYIGVTSLRNPADRWQGGSGYGHNEYFTFAIRKYGWGNIAHDVLLANLSESEAYIRESELIARHHSNDRRFGYNLTTGGEKAKRHAEESKLKMSRNRQGLNVGESHHNYQKPMPTTTRQAISKANKGNKYCLGKHHSEQARRRMSQNHADVNGVNNPRYGISHTEASKKKIAENRTYTTGAQHPSSKGVIQCTLDGKMLRAWDSCTTAMNEFRNQYSGSIKACCQGRTKTAYGYVWKYASENLAPREGVLLRL